MRTISHAVLGPSVVFLVSAWLLILPAQAQPLAGRGGAASSATIVQTGAGTLDLARLSPISQDDLPAVGSFFLASGGPPLPCPPGRFDPSRYDADAVAAAPAYVIDAQHGVYLVDDRAILAQQMLAQAASVPMPGDGGGGGGSSSGGGGWSGPQYGSNDFYLQPVSLAGNLFSVVAHGTTNGATYIITSAESANPQTNTTWLVEGSLQGGTNDATPFALGIATRTNSLFIRAQPCDECATTALPLWWQLAYFGLTGIDPNGDFDGDGVSNLAEYLNGTDPNTINFFTDMGSQYVNANSVPVTLSVIGGVPSNMAVLLDSTNFAAAAWTNVDLNPVVGLGGTEGWHNVWVGLRGRLEASQQTWQRLRVKLLLTPPTLTVTNPAGLTVDQPVIQLQGYCPEALAGLSYDLTNAAGLVTNQPALVVHQYYDPNTLEFTTNYFQCFDVQLTNGANTITFYATDLAGNTTITNFTFTLDYSGKTNPPVVVLGWPQDGTQISGSNFTWRGWISDPTAQVTAQIVDTNGVTNILSGIVQHDGSFRVEDLPLAEGPNALTLTVADAAGNSAVTNITATQSDLGLTIDSVGWYSAWGTISDTNYTVWVNGAQAVVYDWGFEIVWNADLQLDLDNTQVQARAIPNSGDMMSSRSMSGPSQDAMGGGSASSASLSNPGSPQAVDAEAAFEVPSGWTYIESWNNVEHYAGPVWWFPGRSQYDYTIHWAERSGGSGSYYEPPTGEWDDYIYFPGRYPDYGDGVSLSGFDGTTNGEVSAVMLLDWWNHCDDSYTAPDGSIDWSQTSGGDIAFVTGGAPNESGDGLFLLTASVFKWIPAAPDVIPGSGGYFPPEQISLGALGKLDTDGYLAANLPLHSQVPCAPRVGAKQYQGIVQGDRYKIVPQCYAFSPPNRARTTIGVGEQVLLQFSPPLPTSAKWSTSGGQLSVTNAPTVTFTAPNHAANVTVTATVKGRTSRITFKVCEPTGFHHAVITQTNNVPNFTALTNGVAGAAMLLDVYIGPTNVSFYRVSVMEVGLDASNVIGYFTNSTTLHHYSDVWARLNEANVWPDQCGIGPLPAPWYSGSFSWSIPARWQVADSGETNVMDGWNQVFSLLDTSGTVKIDKFTRWVERTTDNVITTH